MIPPVIIKAKTPGCRAITIVFMIVPLIPGHSQVKNGRYVSENSETGEMIDIRLEKGSFIYRRVSIQDSMYACGNFSISEKNSC